MKKVSKSIAVLLSVVITATSATGCYMPNKNSPNSNSGENRTEEQLTTEMMMSLGQKYLNEMNYEQAKAMFAQAIELEPKNINAYFGIAQAYRGLNDNENALVNLDKGIELAKESTEAGVQDVLGRMYLQSAVIKEERGEYQAAISDYDNAVKTDVVNAADITEKKDNAVSKLASQQEQDGNYEEAIKLYEDMKNTNPEKAYRNISDIYLKNGDPVKAVEVINEGIEEVIDKVSLNERKKWIIDNTVRTECITNNYKTKYSYDKTKLLK